MPNIVNNQNEETMDSLLPMILIIPIFYFLIFRPKQKEMKVLQETQKNLVKGDKILTQGGVVGNVVTVRDDSLVILSSDAKLEVSTTSVVKKMEK
jgi:preprotein translocase subunit YajC